MMNKQEILKKIGNIIQELNEQHEYLSNAKEISALELELFTANADFLTDHIAILKKLNSVDVNKPAVEAPKESTPLMSAEIGETDTEEAQEPVPSVEEPEKEGIPAFKFNFEEPKDLVFDFEKNIKVEEVFDREITEAEQEVISKIKQTEENQQEDLSANNIAGPEVVAVAEENYPKLDETLDPQTEDESEEPYLIAKEEQPIAELPQPKEEPVIEVFSQSTPIEPIKQEAAKEAAAEPDKKLSLNEMLSAQRNPAASYSRPITDLKTAISLNDKMIFIRELFNGYNLAYSEAIEILNRFDSFEAADNFLLKNYADKNNWAQKQDVVDRLYEILNRKFKN